MAPQPLRLLLLDADPGLAARIAADPRFDVTGCATGSEAEAALADTAADCALTRPDSLRELRRIAPGLALVALARPGDDPVQGAQDRLAPAEAHGDVLERAVRYAIDRKRGELERSRLAFHDALTGLPNRDLLRDRIAQAFARLPRSGRKLALLHLDVDGFQLVNDSLGHAAGDALLKQVAERLRAVMRPADTVARMGADEFAVLCDDMVPAADAAAVVKRVRSALAAPFTVAGVDHHATASVGIAVTGAGGSVAALLREADAALEAAKQHGGGWERYDDALRDRALQRLTLQNELHRALARDELVLHYQPQVALGVGGTTGVEALVRWEHPDRGLLAPDEFIPEAEACGLIVPLGRWVLREACEQLARWQDVGGRMAGLLMCVNLSARQLAQPDLVEEVAGILDAAGVEPARICLEITETAVLEDAELTRTHLHALKALGVKLAVDDFGTGYSSLSHLDRFPVDVLKIDRSFVQGMEDAGGHRRGVVAAVIRLAGAMGLQPVAEGVEIEAQADELRALGCRSAQGFLWSAAREPDEVEQLIESAPPARRPIRVVVCDDAPAMRALMRHSLSLDADIEVVGEAADGEAVVDVVSETRPDVVMLDLSMPHVDGLTALPRILEAAPWVGVVVLSGRDEAAAAPQALALGAERFMAKPAGIAEIRAAVLGVGTRTPLS